MTDRYIRKYHRKLKKHEKKKCSKELMDKLLFYEHNQRNTLKAKKQYLKLLKLKYLILKRYTNTLCDLDSILKYKRNIPKAKRLLETRQYRKLFQVQCPHLVKYKRGKGIAYAVSNHIMEKITRRMKAKDIVSLIYKEIKKLPLDILVSIPGHGNTSPKVKWHHIHIKDKYIRKELQRQLQRAHYTACTCGSKLIIRTW